MEEAAAAAGTVLHDDVPSISRPAPEFDAHCMRLALQQAKVAFDRGEVPVGCVLVYPGRIDGVAASPLPAAVEVGPTPLYYTVVAHACNDVNATCNATRHAEMLVLEQVYTPRCATPTAVLKACTLYVTIEPCIMCAAALLKSDLTRVVFGARNARFGGCGSVLPILRVTPPCASQPMEVMEGVCADECAELMRAFFADPNPAMAAAHSSGNAGDGSHAVCSAE